MTPFLWGCLSIRVPVQFLSTLERPSSCIRLHCSHLKRFPPPRQIMVNLICTWLTFVPTILYVKTLIFIRAKKLIFFPQVVLVNFSISFSGLWHLRKPHLGPWVPAVEKNFLECHFDWAWPLSASSCRRSPSTYSGGSAKAQTSDYMAKAIFWKYLPQ